MTAQVDVPLKGTQGGTQAAERVADVLLLLMDARQPLGVTQVASELRVAKSVAHRILTSLVSRSLVEQAPRTDAYRLGTAAIAIGARAFSRSDIEAISVTHLEALRDETGETVLLSRPVAGGRVYVAQYVSPRAVRMTVELGARRPWHVGASGKILLAYASDELRERMILQESEEYDLDEHAVEDLRAQLLQARSRGYAVSGGERNPDAGAVAAPILGLGDVAVAAVSVCGPLSRFDPRAAETHAPLVLKVAGELSHRLRSAGP